jgi:hypothetical protein
VILSLGRFTKTVSDATIGTAIVLAHVVLAERLEQQRRMHSRKLDLRGKFGEPTLPGAAATRRSQ